MTYPIRFNDQGEALCSRCSARARTVTIAAYIKPQPRPHLVASDGKQIVLDMARCGRHNSRISSDGILTIPAAALGQDSEDNLDFALRAYERDLASRLEREQRQVAEYQKRLADIAAMTEDDFTITRIAGLGYTVTISGPTYLDEPRPISGIIVEPDHGVWTVRTSDYTGSTGAGRGSPAFALLFSRLLAEAATYAAEANRGTES